ncbi:glycosyltransferase family 32 protein [Didymella exigua CBS 183.55]|uniref:Glycosyltransferase family 32 protein n=1 Tax=Didymella exigua CBS 183.55 TaxID=1150837 RepID=A0A6A5RQF3_9PLEO|nr:glycosyltransferase family 32 protein [Didymella exigua CBS 183.55]KAF1928536.1 glycosyltransferase family 32 protein [Didymella exigua CBS 183.55]
MRSRPTLTKTIVLLPLLIAVYYIRCQHTFQCALKNLRVSFDDLPSSYSSALNASRAQGELLLDFDYNTTFTSPLIPRTIHFIYFADLYHGRDGTPLLPATSRSRAPELCRKYNPSFEIRIWNKTEAHTFIETEYPWFIPIYDAYRHPIQRVDALKYFVLYHFGGVYMDLDVACRRPLEPLLQFPAWFPEASPLGVNNDLMASMPHHPMLLEMTSALARRNRDLLFPYLTVFWSTGPQFSSDMLRGWWWRHAARMSTRDTASFRILPQIFYSEEYTFFGHSPGGTWHGGDVAVIIWLAERPLALLCIAIGCLALALGIMKGMKLRKVRHRHVEEAIPRTE